MILLRYIFLLLSGIASAAPLCAQWEEPVDSLELANMRGDSLKDSTHVHDDVTPDTRIFSPDAFLRGAEFLRDVSVPLRTVAYSDDLDTLPGFSQTLGIMSKPYVRYMDGAPSWFFPGNRMINPITRKEEAYMTNPLTQALFIDSRTPYVNINYTQGRRKYSVLKTTVSHNISPFINATAHFGRRNVNTGSYAEFTTDDYNLWLSARVRSKNARYHALASAVFDELSDEINGGLYPYASADSFTFSKLVDFVMLTDAELYRKHRSLMLRQFYELLPHRRDSTASPHRVVLSSLILGDEFRNKYRDVFQASDNNTLFPVYPTMDTTQIMEVGQVSSLTFEEGIAYQYRSERFFFSQRIIAANEMARFTKDTILYQANQFTATLAGELSLTPETSAFNAHYEVRRRTSSRFEPESSALAGISLKLFRKTAQDTVWTTAEPWMRKDSSRTAVSYFPVQLFAKVAVQSRNPSWQQLFWPSATGNTFSADRNLMNEQMRSFSAGAELTGKIKREGDFINPASYLRVNGFFTSFANWIWYDTLMIQRQADDGESMQVVGVNPEFRIRLGKFAWEGSGTLQSLSVNGDSSLVADNSDFLPRWFGKTGIYFERLNIKVADGLRVGVEAVFQSDYFGRLYDPVSQQFYAQTRFELPANIRGDFYLGLRIKKAVVFLRVLNATEGLLNKGYFTTPFYPMQERSFQFGVNWSFFD